MRANDIENAVFCHLYFMYGDKAAYERAIKAAAPDTKEIDELTAQKNEWEEERRTIDLEKNRLVNEFARRL